MQTKRPEALRFRVFLARREGFEPPAFWSVVCMAIWNAVESVGMQENKKARISKGFRPFWNVNRGKHRHYQESQSWEI